MMYLVFLAFLYKLQGGRFRSFVRAALGHDVEADKTPTSQDTSDDRGVSKVRGTVFCSSVVEGVFFVTFPFYSSKCLLENDARLCSCFLAKCTRGGALL